MLLCRKCEVAEAWLACSIHFRLHDQPHHDHMRRALATARMRLTSHTPTGRLQRLRLPFILDLAPLPNFHSPTPHTDRPTQAQPQAWYPPPNVEGSKRSPIRATRAWKIVPQDNSQSTILPRLATTSSTRASDA